MTKEERAEKWFKKIPDSESISLEKKMEICYKTAIGMVVIFFVIYIIERFLLYKLTDGQLFYDMADILNKMSKGVHTRNQYRGVAIVGGLMVLPLMIVPFFATMLFKNRYMKHQVEKLKDNMKVNGSRSEIYSGPSTKKEQKKDFDCSDWVLDVDGTEQVGFTEKELKQNLESIQKGDIDFIILTPPKPIRIQTVGCLCNFVQVCQDKDSNHFHLEVGTIREKKKNDSMIYGKDGLTQEETMSIFRKVIDNSTEFDVKEWEVVLDLRTKADVELYRKMGALLTENTEVRSNLESCLQAPQQYYKEKADFYEERCIEGNQEDSTIIWIGMVDEMLSGYEAIELDWKTDIGDFLYEMKNLASRHHLQIEEDWFNEDEDIPTWCAVLDEKWMDTGFCVGGMDIDSDSYVLFVCRTEVLTQLSDLGKQVGQRFDFAKNM